MRVADLFAGGGGTTTGAVEHGHDVVWAGNHWRLAVELHAMHHPGTIHVCQDLMQHDMTTIPDVDAIWGSPSCKGGSPAGQPGRAANPDVAKQHDRDRASAWAVLEAAQAKLPPVVLVENVLGMETEWLFFPEWLRCMEKLGYDARRHVLNALRFGVPQDRTRLIWSFSRLGAPLELREPGIRPPKTLRDLLDFDDGEWIRIEDIERPGARRRATYAHETYGGRPCWGQHVSHRGAWARSLDRYANTLTTQGQHYVVAEGLYRRWTNREQALVTGFPGDYFDGVGTTAASKMAGNAVPPPMAGHLLDQAAEHVARYG